MSSVKITKSHLNYDAAKPRSKVNGRLSVGNEYRWQEKTSKRVPQTNIRTNIHPGLSTTAGFAHSKHESVHILYRDAKQPTATKGSGSNSPEDQCNCPRPSGWPFFDGTTKSPLQDMIGWCGPKLRTQRFVTFAGLTPALLFFRRTAARAANASVCSFPNKEGPLNSKLCLQIAEGFTCVMTLARLSKTRPHILHRSVSTHCEIADFFA